MDRLFFSKVWIRFSGSEFVLLISLALKFAIDGDYILDGDQMVIISISLTIHKNSLDAGKISPLGTSPAETSCRNHWSALKTESCNARTYIPENLTGILWKTDKKPLWAWTWVSSHHEGAKLAPNWKLDLFEHIDRFEISFTFFGLILSCPPLLKEGTTVSFQHSAVVIDVPAIMLSQMLSCE